MGVRPCDHRSNEKELTCWWSKTVYNRGIGSALGSSWSKFRTDLFLKPTRIEPGHRRARDRKSRAIAKPWVPNVKAYLCLMRAGLNVMYPKRSIKESMTALGSCAKKFYFSEFVENPPNKTIAILAILLSVSLNTAISVHSATFPIQSP